MARPTVAGNAYRWACPMVERMIRHRPAIATDLLQADAATKHFVALAIRGWELHQGGCERALRRLSEDLFSRPRPAVLAEIWGVGLGKLGFLKRLPGRVLSRPYYDHLVAAWSDPARRKLLSQCARISPGEIETIALVDQPLHVASARAIKKIGAELFDYVLGVVRRHRPDLDDMGLAAALRELKRGEDLAVWLRNVLGHADLPPPPCAVDPLPGLGDDVLFQPLASSIGDRLDREDRAVLGNPEIAHVGGFHRDGGHGPSIRRTRGTPA
jgi:hypothetical protein